MAFPAHATPGRVRQICHRTAPSPTMKTLPDYYATTQWWRKAASTTGQAQLSAMVHACLAYVEASASPGIPFDIEADNVVFEYRISNGRVDAAVLLADGSLTLVEKKDGAAGASSVLCGIGQVTMHALTAGLSAGRLREVRKALLWSSTGDVLQNVLIEICCAQAGVIPMQFGPMDPQIASARQALIKLNQVGETSDA